ncbi:MAG: HAD-IA family hydrolase [Candidatus Lernaella stagnicola]|nr:HAD-IA family hydrolase [Candidatus Lernaella stagnicola]
MAGLQALICDLDMTLIDSRRDIAAALVRAMQVELGVAATERDAAALIGRPLISMMRQLAPGSDEAALARAVATYKDIFFRHCADYTVVFPGVRETLTRLRRGGVRTAVATTKMTFMARRVCQVLDLAEWFDHIQGTDNFPAKPDPTVIRRACLALEVPPEAALIVGDTTMDVRAASAAGGVAVAVSYGIDTVADLKAVGATRIIDDFVEVADFFRVT